MNGLSSSEPLTGDKESLEKKKNLTMILKPMTVRFVSPFHKLKCFY